MNIMMEKYAELRDKSLAVLSRVNETAFIKGLSKVNEAIYKVEITELQLHPQVCINQLPISLGKTKHLPPIRKPAEFTLRIQMKELPHMDTKHLCFNDKIKAHNENIEYMKGILREILTSINLSSGELELDVFKLAGICAWGAKTDSLRWSKDGDPIGFEFDYMIAHDGLEVRIDT